MYGPSSSFNCVYRIQMDGKESPTNFFFTILSGCGLMEGVRCSVSFPQIKRTYTMSGKILKIRILRCINCALPNMHMLR